MIQKIWWPQKYSTFFFRFSSLLKKEHIYQNYLLTKNMKADSLIKFEG